MPTLQWRCVNGPGLVSEDIKFRSDGIVCHVEFVFASVTINGVTHTNVSIGARADGGVQIRPLDHYPVDIRSSAECTQEQYDAMLAFLTAQIGKGYDFRGIVGELLNLNLHSKDRWYCSWLWRAVLEAGKLIKALPAAVTSFTPEDALLVSSAMFGTS